MLVKYFIFFLVLILTVEKNGGHLPGKDSFCLQQHSKTHYQKSSEHNPSTKVCTPYIFHSYSLLKDIVELIISIFEIIIGTFFFLVNIIVMTVCQVINGLFFGVQHCVKLVELVVKSVGILLDCNYKIVSSIFALISDAYNHILEGLKYLFYQIKILVQTLLACLWSLLQYTFHTITILLKFIIDFPMICVRFFSRIIEKTVDGVIFLLQFLGSTFTSVFQGISYILSLFTSVISEIFSTANGIVLKISSCTYNVITTFFTVLIQLTIQTITMVAQIFMSTIDFITFIVLSLYNGTLHIALTCKIELVSFIQTILGILRTICEAFIKIYNLAAKGTSTSLDVASTGASEVVKMLSTMTENCLYLISSIWATCDLYIPGGALSIPCVFLGITFGHIMRNMLSNETKEFVKRIFMHIWHTLCVFGSAFSHSHHSIRQVVNREDERPQNTVANTVVCDNTPNNSNIKETEKNIALQLEQEREKMLCVICQDSTKNMLLIPCRHMCLCRNCADILVRSRWDRRVCPLCRQAITEIVEVFV